MSRSLQRARPDHQFAGCHCSVRHRAAGTRHWGLVGCGRPLGIGCVCSSGAGVGCARGMAGGSTGTLRVKEARARAAHAIPNPVMTHDACTIMLQPSYLRFTQPPPPNHHHTHTHLHLHLCHTQAHAGTPTNTQAQTHVTPPPNPHTRARPRVPSACLTRCAGWRSPPGSQTPCCPWPFQQTSAAPAR